MIRLLVFCFFTIAQAAQSCLDASPDACIMNHESCIMLLSGNTAAFLFSSLRIKLDKQVI
jgi:hypothetical protein